jgi:hypothetical protein
MICEPLAGARALCPVPKEVATALASPARTIKGLVRAAEASDGNWGAHSAINLTGLSTTAGEMTDALAKLADKEVAELIDWTSDPAIINIVTNWPAYIDTARARAIGLLHDSDFESFIRSCMSENPDAVAHTQVQQ